jgi:hypothetical protein
MSREVGFYDKETGEVRWVPVEKLKDYAAERRKNPVAPMIIQDTIDWMKHPGDGRFYDSRSAFEQVNKAMGLVQRDIPKDFDFDRDGTTRSLSKEELASIEADIDQATQRTYHGLKNDAINLTEDQRQYAKAVNETLEATIGTAAIK